MEFDAVVVKPVCTTDAFAESLQQRICVTTRALSLTSWHPYISEAIRVAFASVRCPRGLSSV